MIAPFAWNPPSDCPNEKSEGVLLVHGLSDTTFIVQDLARALNRRCFLVFGLLLPGHGTRPADMLKVSRKDWQKTVDYGVRRLGTRVNKVHLIGYSLGGILVADAALNHPETTSVTLLSPAINVMLPSLVWHSQWLRYVTDWLDVDPVTSAVRYKAKPTNAVAEVFALSKEVQARLPLFKKRQVPVLLMQSMEEMAIDPAANQLSFDSYLRYGKNKLVAYTNNPAAYVEDRFLMIRNSYFPERKILNFSHTSLPNHPDNPLLGVRGTLKECGQNVGIIDPEEASQCLRNESNWLGELNSSTNRAHYPLQRLTYNPDFDGTLKTIVDFMANAPDSTTKGIVPRQSSPQAH